MCWAIDISWRWRMGNRRCWNESQAVGVIRAGLLIAVSYVSRFR